ncbi:MAG: hypothetical protein LIR50_07200 [Bacillota bacterium]|nr:hypothetical protein [Bacillota bacterium]
MALIKPIKQNNGIILSYHRIHDIKNIVNDKTIICVYSYVDKEEREKEKILVEGFIPKYLVYVVMSEEELEYNDNLSIKQAYEYLKTLDKYKDAQDD